MIVAVSLFGDAGFVTQVDRDALYIQPGAKLPGEILVLVIQAKGLPYCAAQALAFIDSDGNQRTGIKTAADAKRADLGANQQRNIKAGKFGACGAAALRSDVNIF